jgi:serine/threonine protein kinase
MSPEIWNNRPYDASSDLWSLGCMMYELCALRPPFVADSFPALKRAVTHGKYQPIPRKFTDQLAKTIGLMLNLDPRRRPTAEQLLAHPEVAKKMHLDGAVVPKDGPAAFPGMMHTIKVPQNLKKLNQALPKPCYADARPDSPVAWSFADQKDHQRKMRKEAQSAATEAQKAAAALATEVNEDNKHTPAPETMPKPPAPTQQKHMKVPQAPSARPDDENVAPRNRNASHRPTPRYEGYKNGQYKQPSAREAPPMAPVQEQRHKYLYGGGSKPEQGKARHDPYQNNPQYGYGQGYGQAYGQGGNNHVRAAPPVNASAAGPGAPSAYYDKYNVGRRAAGAPSRAYLQRMW